MGLAHVRRALHLPSAPGGRPLPTVTVSVPVPSRSCRPASCDRHPSTLSAGPSPVTVSRLTCDASLPSAEPARITSTEGDTSCCGIFLFGEGLYPFGLKTLSFPSPVASSLVAKVPSLTSPVSDSHRSPLVHTGDPCLTLVTPGSHRSPLPNTGHPWLTPVTPD